MDHPKCEVCGEPATIHETAIENGVAVGLHHLCKQHGESHWRSALQAAESRSQDALAQFTEWYRGRNGSVVEHLARQPVDPVR
jgi:hypothetical protein